ncbi:hypothetical protein MY04_0810 [Flammeovirga sp. MY04]|uniref:hypothetical protein n=1 Tax=Flammeovirga sp. MY04 TaxID=1191459 RepID=UPI0008063F19|nr:hypothetical protein [Flammeovirga sp. MY04]ANQ48192.1 hypothetical protein MY04_0810 [Flammeovirga sp. MY04]
MEEIILEFEELEILRPKKRWKLYFVVLTEHPTDKDKWILTTIPNESHGVIQLKPRAENKIYFEPQDAVGANGLFVLDRNMPESRRIKVRVFLRHSRENARNAGQILSDVESALGEEAFGQVTNLLGRTNPWLVIGKEAVQKVGKILSNIKDRDFGLITMDEEFGPEFENQSELDRMNNFSTGDARLVWSWATRNKS